MFRTNFRTLKENSIGTISALLLLFVLGFGISAIPEHLIARIGGVLSPRGAISESFIPVFHKVLLVISLSLGSVLLGVIIWWRRVLLWVCMAISRMKSELGHGLVALKSHLNDLSMMERMTIVILIAMGMGVRLWYLNQPMRFDEATTVLQYASLPWYIGLANYSQPNNHLLNTLLTRICLLIVGEKEWMVRLPAFMAGLLCLPLIYAYARRFYSREAALIALAWGCFSLSYVDMSTNARGYTLVACLGLVSHLAIQPILRHGSLIAAVFNALAIGLGLVAVPVAMLYVISSLLWSFFYALSLRSREQQNPSGLLILTGSIVAGGGIALLGYLPMLLIMGPKWLIANEWVRPLDWGRFIRQLPDQLWSYLRYNVLYLPTAIVGLMGVSAGYYLFKWKRIEKTRISLPFLLIGVCLVILMLNRRYPLWGLSPMWMFLSAVLFCAMSAGFSHLVLAALAPRVTRLFVAMASLFLCGLGIWNLVKENPSQTLSPLGDYSFSDVPLVIQYLAARASPEDEILLDNGFAVHQYYARLQGVRHLKWNGNPSEPRTIFLLETTSPNPHYERAIWRRLNELGIQSTVDMTMEYEFSDHRIWSADLTH